MRAKAKVTPSQPQRRLTEDEMRRWLKSDTFREQLREELLDGKRDGYCVVVLSPTNYRLREFRAGVSLRPASTYAGEKSQS